MSSSWTSYPKVWNMGHAQVRDVFRDPVLVEEKIDGSQLSFGVFDGELKVRSHKKEMVLDAPEKLFNLAIATITAIKDKLIPGWTYRGEYLSKPKHNVLAYERVPAGNIVLFDINDGLESYLAYHVVADEARRLGLEVAPRLYEGLVLNAEQLADLLETVSFLGGQKIEGVVCKNYRRFGADGKALMAKHVSEAFKEVHAAEWKKENPAAGDVLQTLIMRYRTPARWIKAVQRLAEAGTLQHAPQDIGALIKSTQQDVEEECADEIRAALWKWAWPKICRAIVGGLPEWYKEQLLKEQFNHDTDGDLDATDAGAAPGEPANHADGDGPQG